MRFKVGDRVRIKSIDWYNENKDENGNIDVSHDFTFYTDRSKYCGKVFTIDEVFDNRYTVKEDNHEYYWADEMIEGLVEEEAKPEPKFKVGDEVRIKGTDIGGTIESVIRGQLIVNYKGSKIPAWPEDVVLMKSVEEETKPNIIEEAKTYWDSIKDAWHCPDGYIFKDENGNVINATKIVLEKKKKKYPKTYEECCRIFQYNENLKVYPPFSADIPNYDALHLFGLLEALRKLLICRDAYWKIAGEETGLGKPWEPDWKNSEERRYCIVNIEGDINLPEKILTKWILKVTNKILVFPTEEMRDAFKENFDPDIEFCKELL